MSKNNGPAVKIASNTLNTMKPVVVLKDFATFLKQGVLAAKTTGTVTPSSPALARCIIDLAQLHECRTVVEFGPGTGAVTDFILKNLPNSAAFFAMEINPEFVAVLRKKYPNVTIVEDSAGNVVQHLQTRELDSCDCIISGLPWALFPESLQNEILDAAWQALRPNGRFITFTYFFSLWTSGGKRFRSMLSERFSNKVYLSPIIWGNFPPARVYCATKM